MFTVANHMNVLKANTHLLFYTSWTCFRGFQTFQPQNKGATDWRPRPLTLEVAYNTVHSCTHVLLSPMQPWESVHHKRTST